MKRNSIIGIILVVLGILAFSFQSINFRTSDNTVDIGPVHVVTEKDRQVPLLPPIAGAIALIGGITMLIMEQRKD